MIKAKILIVEDEIIVAKDIQRSLEKSGYSVVAIAVSGKAAIKKTTQMQPDMVLMDIKLKGEMDGIEAAEKIRARFGIPVIYLTAFADATTLGRAKTTGPFGYILKPYDEHGLSPAIEMALYRHKMTKRIEESEKRYEQLYSSMNEGLALHELIYNEAGKAIDYKILDVNPAFEKIVGIKKVVAIGAKASALYGIAPAPYLDIYADVVRSGKPLTFETLFSQTNRAFKISVFSPAENQFVTLFADITERALAEQALQESENKFRATISQASDGILIADQDFRIIEWSAAQTDIFGYTREEMLDKPLWEFQYLITPEEQRAPALLELLENRLLEIHPKRDAAWMNAIQDFEIQAKGGRRSAVQVSSFPIATNSTTLYGAITRDVTKRVQMERVLQESENNLKEAQRIANMGSWVWDLKTNAVTWSDHLCLMHGVRPEEFDGKFDTVMSFTHPDDLESVQKEIQKMLVEKKSTNFEYRIITKNGVLKVLQGEQQLFFDDKGNVEKMLGMLHDITKRKQFEQRLQHAATHDPLTGLANRMLFFDRLTHALTKADRHKAQLAVLFIDLDGFKSVNDTFGHEAGDQLLVEFARRLKKSVRKSDTVARLAGDEFTVIIEAITSRANAAQVVEKILAQCTGTYRLGENEVMVAHSTGISLYPHDATDIDSLIRHADTAMYRAKQKGKNGYRFFSKVDEKSAA